MSAPRYDRRMAFAWNVIVWALYFLSRTAARARRQRRRFLPASVTIRTHRRTYHL